MYSDLSVRFFRMSSRYRPLRKKVMHEHMHPKLLDALDNFLEFPNGWLTAQLSNLGMEAYKSENLLANL